MNPNEVYAPDPDFVSKANVSGMEACRALYQKAEQNPEEFWGELAASQLHWFQKRSHVNSPRKDKIAILWEGAISYAELHRLVCRFVNVLKARGLKAGDRSIIYMPMIPELPIAMLAAGDCPSVRDVIVCADGFGNPDEGRPRLKVA